MFLWETTIVVRADSPTGEAKTKSHLGPSHIHPASIPPVPAPAWRGVGNVCGSQINRKQMTEMQVNGTSLAPATPWESLRGKGWAGKEAQVKR